LDEGTKRNEKGALSRKLECPGERTMDQSHYYNSAPLFDNSHDGRSERDICSHCGQRTDAPLLAREATIWGRRDTYKIAVHVTDHRIVRFLHGWENLCGAHHQSWQRMSDLARVRLMLEVALDLATQNFPLGVILREFSRVAEFRALANKSAPLGRALQRALAEKSAEPAAAPRTTTPT
jgi:hypothetical protein